MSDLLRPEDLNQLLLTPRQIAIPTLTPVVVANMAARREVERFISTLESWIEDLDGVRERWAGSERLVVPDTNVFLHGPQIDQIDWYGSLTMSDRSTRIRIVVPLLVIDELDNLKDKGQGAVRTQARSTLRTLEEILRSASPDQAIALECNGLDSTVTIEILLDAPDHERLKDADNEIIDQALFLQEVTGRVVTVLTGDLGIALRARATGLDVELQTFRE